MMLANEFNYNEAIMSEMKTLYKTGLRVQMQMQMERSQFGEFGIHQICTYVKQKGSICFSPRYLLFFFVFSSTESNCCWAPLHSYSSQLAYLTCVPDLYRFTINVYKFQQLCPALRCDQQKPANKQLWWW